MSGRRDTVKVAPEANMLEQALRQAGIDPDGVMSYPVWDMFTHRGLRAALTMLQKNVAMDENRRTASQ